jgi:hypothetical protein
VLGGVDGDFGLVGPESRRQSETIEAKPTIPVLPTFVRLGAVHTACVGRSLGVSRPRRSPHHLAILSGGPFRLIIPPRVRCNVHGDVEQAAVAVDLSEHTLAALSEPSDKERPAECLLLTPAERGDLTPVLADGLV